VSLHELAGSAGAVTGQFISGDLGRNSIEDPKFLPRIDTTPDNSEDYSFVKGCCMDRFISQPCKEFSSWIFLANPLPMQI
jgi:hypothetical protein